MKDKINKIKKSIGKVIPKIKDSLYEEGEYEEFKKSSTSFSIYEVIIVICIALLFGVLIGYMITYSRPEVQSRDKRFDEIMDTYNNILETYYDKVDGDELADAAIKGMIDSLNDPYSNYMDVETTENFSETVDGAFVGIGITVLFTDDGNKIVDVNKGGPADKAGIKIGDIITKIDSNDVLKVDSRKLQKLIRGSKNSKLEITVKRDGKEKVFKVKRSVIETISVNERVIDYSNSKVGYIQITTFAANSFKQFNNSLKRLENKNVNSLIIDVRNNPGGHLGQVREILSLFFDDDVVLFRTVAKKKETKIKSLGKKNKKIPIAVIINVKSASASEILASSFKDNYKNSVIVGERSYGKGTVQKSKVLSDGTSIKYTIQKWLTAKGNWIEKKGVSPDCEIELSDDYYKNPSDDTDNQLQEALKKLVEISH